MNQIERIQYAKDFLSKYLRLRTNDNKKQLQEKLLWLGKFAQIYTQSVLEGLIDEEKVLFNPEDSKKIDIDIEKFYNFVKVDFENDELEAVKISLRNVDTIIFQVIFQNLNSYLQEVSKK